MYKNLLQHSTMEDKTKKEFDDSGIPGSFKYGNSYFRDCERRIDFILAYIEDQDRTKIDLRVNFQKHLIGEGLHLELEKSVDPEKLLYFVKIHMPEDVFLDYAEIMNFKYIFKKEINVEKKSFLFECLNCIRRRVETPFFSYRTSILNNSLITEEKDKFSEGDRIKVINNILARSWYGPGEQDHGIIRLLNKGVYIAAYPMHDGNYQFDVPPEERCLRRQLYQEWASYSSFLKVQPLDLIHEYFGEEIALFFSWLGYYTEMLFYAAFIGVIFFLYGILTSTDEYMIVSTEICESNLIMCPKCSNLKLCKFTRLRDSCFYSRISYLFDNASTVFFAVFMSIWGAVFVHLWRRKQSVLSWRWDLASVQFDDDIHPEYEKKAKYMKLNLATQKLEACVPQDILYVRRTSALVGLMLFICVRIGIFVCLIIVRFRLSTLLDKSSYKQYGNVISGYCSSSLSICTMMIMEAVFKIVSPWLTNLETPRTNLEYEDSLAIKSCVFTFVNYNISLIYMAFFKGMLHLFPGYEIELAGFQYDTCDPSGCLSELFIELSTIMIINQISRLYNTYVNPKLTKLIGKSFFGFWTKRSNSELSFPSWERDYHLFPITSHSLRIKQLQMIVQYGFVALYASAFPLAAFFAFLNNVIEIRIYAHELIVSSRRPIPRKVPSLTITEKFFKRLTYFAVFTNAFLIAFTSEIVPRFVYRLKHSGQLKGYINSTLSVFDTRDYGNGTYPNATCRYRGYRHAPSSLHKYSYNRRFWYILSTKSVFIVLFEHFILCVAGILAFLIPEIPEHVKRNIARERKEARLMRAKLIEHTKLD